MAYRPCGHTGSSGRLLTRREFVRSAGVAGLAAVMVSAAPFQPPRSFVVSRHERSLRGLDGPLRLALLTDLHLGPYLGEEELERWVAATLREEPDVVLLGGDLVDQRYRGDLSELARHLPRLAAPLGVYAVLGNHDHARFRRIDALTDMLAAAGVTLLANDAARLREDLVLAGIDDLRVGRPDLDATLAAARRSGAEDGGATALLSHNPDVIPEVPGDVDLVLAGHTHGGQVRLPLVGAVVTSSRYGRRYLSGWVEAPMPAFVSRGLGVTGLPFRYDCPAELAVITLLPG
ncbi:MAG TPA: metallophosphoesterase [Trueperaceae bacterium]|nr:metallophosphoesterase [Trueperaceae bacterium]